jgi:3',5'-cyclic-AMP phosphodiesterase
MIVAQISDLHVAAEGHLLHGCYDTGASLVRCVQHLLQRVPRPDVVLATGDLVERGEAQEYQRLRRLLEPLALPLYVIPGNHDDRGALRAAFPDHAYLPREGSSLSYVVEDHPLRMIGLDTLIPGAGGGTLDGAQLDWLDAQLAAAPLRRTLVFMHHPPFRTGIPRMDELGFEAGGAARLASVLARHRHVERVICGHVHRSIQTLWRGTAVTVCPSTAFQYSLRLEPGKLEPASDEPPAYQLHGWNGAELVTHTVPVTGNQ